MSTATAPTKSTRIIWVEDNPDFIQGWVNSIKRKTKQRLDIKIVENSQALETIINEDPMAFVFDIKLGKGPDGITLAKRIRQKNKIIPIRFVSTYLNEYKERLKEVDNLSGIYDRDDLEDEKFSSFWQELANDAYSYETYFYKKVADITWNEFVNSTSQKTQEEIVYAHARLFTKLAMSIMKNREWSWVAFCGERIVGGSKFMNKFPTLEEKKKLSNKHSGFVFVYAQPIVSEESGGDVRLLGYYPKIQIKIGDKVALANFDTGTNRTLLSDRLTTPDPGSIPCKQFHLGRPYEYFTNQRSLSLHSYNEPSEFVGPVNMPVAIVKDWDGENSPWNIVNPEREALLGRDVFAIDRIIIQIVSTSELSVSTTIAKLKK